MGGGPRGWGRVFGGLGKGSGGPPRMGGGQKGNWESLGGWGRVLGGPWGMGWGAEGVGRGPRGSGGGSGWVLGGLGKGPGGLGGKGKVLGGPWATGGVLVGEFGEGSVGTGLCLGSPGGVLQGEGSWDAPQSFRVLRRLLGDPQGCGLGGGQLWGGFWGSLGVWGRSRGALGDPGGIPRSFGGSLGGLAGPWWFGELPGALGEARGGVGGVPGGIWGAS